MSNVNLSTAQYDSTTISHLSNGYAVPLFTTRGCGLTQNEEWSTHILDVNSHSAPAAQLFSESPFEVLTHRINRHHCHVMNVDVDECDWEASPWSGVNKSRRVFELKSSCPSKGCPDPVMVSSSLFYGSTAIDHAPLRV